MGYSRVQGVGGYQYSLKTGMVGRDPSGHDLANDANGSCYWIDSQAMDPLWDFHDSRLAEHELGFNKDSMNGASYYRIDAPDLSNYNLRTASGYEEGANDNFTGIVCDANGNPVKDANNVNIVDPSIYNERTSGGLPEKVSDKVNLDDCSVSGPVKFKDPNKEAADLRAEAADIRSQPDGPQKDAAIADWNNRANGLSDRMSREQSYLDGRIGQHEARMGEYPPGSLEHTRAADNRNWCQEYSDELGRSRDQLLAAQRGLNNGTDLGNGMC